MRTDFPKPYFIRSNGIRLAVYEQGSGFPVIFCHGFPELAFSWRYQLPALAAAGFRAIALDQRGYGRSSKPDSVAEYDIPHLAADLIAVLDALGLEKAVFCGPDWGGHLVWEMPILHPERVAGVIGLNTPHRYFRRMGEDPETWVRNHFSAGNYRLAFLQEGIENELPAELLPRFLGGLFRVRPLTMAEFRAAPAAVRNLEWEFILASALAPEPAGNPLMSPEDLHVYVEAFSGGGLTGPINWYRNLHRNNQVLAGTSDKITVPCLMLSAEDDIFLPPELAENMKEYVPDLEKGLIRECGHWTQLEKPDEVNRLLIDWLGRRFA